MWSRAWLGQARGCPIALAPTDKREVTVAVAGPAALLVAKLHKLGERKDDPGRLVDKDAHNIYRLLIDTDPAVAI